KRLQVYKDFVVPGPVSVCVILISIWEQSRRAACKDKITKAVTHPSSSDARRCLIWLSCDNRRTRYTALLLTHSF
ncbi:hypothetical protein J6590_089463, partial [Homalodisca vitripennis]